MRVHSAEDQKELHRLNTMAGIVAAGLGLTVEPCHQDASPCNWGVNLCDGAEHVLWMTKSNERGKIGISFSRPRDMLHDYTLQEAMKGQTTSIRVNPDRGTNVIISEISRRLMPGVRVLREVCRVRRQESNAYETEMSNLVNELHKALGQGRVNEEKKKNSTYIIETRLGRYDGGTDTIDAEIKPRSAGSYNVASADIKLDNVPIPAAVAILEFIRGYKGKLNDHKDSD